MLCDFEFAMIDSASNVLSKPTANGEMSLQTVSNNVFTIMFSLFKQVNYFFVNPLFGVHNGDI